jgi:hypothetical protein
MEIRRFFIAILFISLCNLGFGQRIRLESAGLTNVSFKEFSEEYQATGLGNIIII